MSARAQLLALVRAARGGLAWHVEQGGHTLPVPPGYEPPDLGAAPATPDPTPDPTPEARPPDLEALATPSSPPAAPSPAPAAPAESTRQVNVCGAADAELAFVIESPAGAPEDPFSGPTGELFAALIEKGLRRDRQAVRVVHLIPRPTEGRAGRPGQADLEQIAAHLQATAPLVIICLGEAASQLLLETRAGITKLQGRWHAWRSIPVMPTIHPELLVQSPALKRPVWLDLKKVLARLRIAASRDNQMDNQASR